jgi:hypothetical protein
MEASADVEREQVAAVRSSSAIAASLRAVA